MSRKRTVRRVYALVNPISHALYQSSKLTVAEWNKQVTPVQVAVDRLSRGDWDNEGSWQPMFECLNRIESLLKLGRVEGQDFVEEAQAVMVAALERRHSSGIVALRAGELAMLREVCKVYGDLLKEASHAQFAAACAHTNANITRILNDKKNARIGGCVFEVRGS